MLTSPKKPHSLTYAWFICLLAALFYCYDFMLRVAPSVMMHPLMHALHINATTFGFIAAFYYYAYTPMQIPTGFIVDRYGCHYTISIAILVCGIANILFATFVNIPMAFFSRFLMGLGSAFGYIGALKLAGIWLPHKQFALFCGIATAMGLAGGLSADNIMVYLVVKYDWKQTSLLIGYLGIALSLIFFLLVRDKPYGARHPSKSYYSLANNIKRVIYLFKNWRFWMLGTVGALLFMPLNVFAALWAPVFFAKVYNLTITQGASYTSLIFIGAIIGNPLIGKLSDIIRSRKDPLIFGGVGALLLTSLLIYVHLPFWILIISLLLLGLCVSTQTLVFSLAKEISPPKTTGTSSSATNFMVTLSAALFQPLIGYFLSTSKKADTLSALAKHHTLHNYKTALLIIPILLVFSLVASLFIPRTGAKPIYNSVRQYKQKKNN